MKSTPRVSFAALVLTALTPLTAQNVGLSLVNNVTSDYLVAPYSPTVVPRTGITVEAWVTYDDTTLPTGWRWPTVVRQNSAAGQESYFLRIAAGNNNARVLDFSVRSPTGNRSANWTFASGQLNTWTHVAGTFDGANIRLLVNGAVVATTTYAGTLLDAGGDFRIGCGDVSANIENWNGQIDEVRLWPFARTPGEITAAMNLEMSSVPGEVSTWNLNGNGQDASGTNHAVAQNAPTFAPNSLTLPAFVFPGLNYGLATTGCQGTPRLAATSVPRVGNADFALGSMRGTVTGAGIFWLGTAPINPPIRVLGVDLYIHPLAPNLLLNVPGGTLAFTRVPLPIPPVNALQSLTLFGQVIWSEIGCATPLFATDGIQFTIML
jgi:hypothetical protein